MTSLSQNDFANLQVDSDGLATSAFVGVLVGFGSMVLHFSNGSSVLVQVYSRCLTVNDCGPAMVSLLKLQ
jgi:hypothetical protein